MPNIPNVYKWTKQVSIALMAATFSSGMGIGALSDANAWTPHHASSEIRPKGVNVYQQVTGDDLEEDRRHWDKVYSTSRSYIFGREPSRFLRDHVHRMGLGHALDIAMGEGRNAVFLAKRGFRVDGVDISKVALDKANRMAQENRVMIHTVAADLTSYPIKLGGYDVILNFDYFQRSLIPKIKRGLREGGYVIFENYILDQLNNPEGENISPDFLLRKNELKELFNDFEILVYQEVNDGREAKARLLARKPSST